MHKLFEKLAISIIEEYTRRLKNASSTNYRVELINNMKSELATLKEAYGIIYIPSEVSEQVFDINAVFALN